MNRQLRLTINRIAHDAARIAYERARDELLGEVRKALKEKRDPDEVLKRARATLTKKPTGQN